MIFNYNQGRFLIQTRKTWLNVELLDVHIEKLLLPRRPKSIVPF